jgi:hypothetical protein
MSGIAMRSGTAGLSGACGGVMSGIAMRSGAAGLSGACGGVMSGIAMRSGAAGLSGAGDGISSGMVMRSGGAGGSGRAGGVGGLKAGRARSQPGADAGLGPSAIPSSALRSCTQLGRVVRYVGEAAGTASVVGVAACSACTSVVAIALASRPVIKRFFGIGLSLCLGLSRQERFAQSALPCSFADVMATQSAATVS